MLSRQSSSLVVSRKSVSTLCQNSLAPVPRSSNLQCQQPSRSTHSHSLTKHLPSTSQHLAPTPQRCSRQGVVTRAGIPSPLDILNFREDYVDVESVKGVRLVIKDVGSSVEYLIKWKDGSEDTWESAANLSEDLIRDYEEKWWAAARKGDIDVLIDMLAGGRQVLAAALDENRRSALHYAAGTGNTEVTKLLVEAGAELDIQDRDGYTPLHMAAGYMHTAPMKVLLEAGANPEIKDNKGQDVVSLVDGLRGRVPLTLQTVTGRLALEEVSNVLTDKLYEEVAPAQVLEVREVASGRQFLLQYDDGRDDEWVDEALISSEILEDYNRGLEYAKAEAIIDVVQVGTERRFKIKWSDSYPTSWEAEENVSPELISLFQQQNPELFEERTSSTSSQFPTLEYETQESTASLQSYGGDVLGSHQGGNGNGSSSRNGSGVEQGEKQTVGAL